jgi:hypothetical protein
MSYVKTYYLQNPSSSSINIALDTSGNVGIGTSSPIGKLDVTQSTNFSLYANHTSTGGYSGVNFLENSASKAYIVHFGTTAFGSERLQLWTESSSAMVFGTSNSERMRIAPNGDINIGAADAGNALRYFDIYNLNTGNSAGAIIRLVTSNSSASGSTTVDLVKYKNAQFSINNNDSAGFTTFNTAGYERMRIASNGYISLGASAGGVRQLHINGGAGSCEIVMGPGDASSTGTNYLNFCNINGNYGEGQGVVIRGLSSSGAAQSTLTYLSVYATSSIFSGSISKGSGSFRIEHPLPALSETHDLVHSFIEGPQADLIYRGKATLVDGLALVNIDEAATMTEGTFVILCRDVQCFTTNETDWTPVRGSVEGNILTIEAKDSKSTATISWMVIGERQDKHMIDTGWTDETGKVIVEPLKRPVVDSFINNTDNV